MTAPVRCRDGRCIKMAPGLCPPCAGWLTGWLTDLPDLYVRLTLNTARSGGHGEPVSGSRELPVPVRLDVLDHMTLIRDQLGSWALVVAEERHLAGPIEVPPFRFLAVHQPWSTQQPWADDYAVEVHDLWRTARALLGAGGGAPEHMAGVACARCDLMALYRFPGRDGRLCDPRAGGCGWWMSDDDYDRWVRLSAHFAKEATG